MIKYKADTLSNKILWVKCDRETDKSIWINGRRISKNTEYSMYFDTFEDAKKFLIEVAMGKVESAKFMLSAANRKLKEIEKLKHGE